MTEGSGGFLGASDFNEHMHREKDAKETRKISQERELKNAVSYDNIDKKNNTEEDQENE
jgi:hypothetical protein